MPRVLTGEHLPSRLRDLPDVPDALFVRGELPRGPAVAIVGTRTPTQEAVAFARQLGRDLALAGVAVLSGGAKGIDAAAHRGALEAHGVTVVVAPAGYATPFPIENAELFRSIVMSGGAYAAVVPDDQVAATAAFFRRNACLVALAHAVVVVQAPIRSGARNAAAWARRLGRPLLVVPSAPWVPQGVGCIIELKRGAIVCESARSVLDALSRLELRPFSQTEGDCGPNGRSSGEEGASGEPPAQGVLFERSSVSGALTAARIEELVLNAVGAGVLHADDLCACLGLPAARVQQALLTLSLRGALVPAPAGGFKTAKPP